MPRQSEYPRLQPPLPPPFQSAAEPPMPYNACFPFKQQAQQPDNSANIYVAGKYICLSLLIPTAVQSSYEVSLLVIVCRDPILDSQKIGGERVRRA